MTSTPALSTDLERIRDLAGRGETTLATIEAIRLLARRPREIEAELLSDLAVLRFGARDHVGSLACVRAAVERDPSCALALENLAALEARLGGAPSTESIDAERATGAATLNPWVVSALAAADSAIGLAGKHVVEVGGCVPPAAVRKLGVASWTACDLRPGEVQDQGYRAIACDAAAIPVGDASFDTAYSVCAFEHFGDVDAVLREVQRVLKPGGRLFTQFAPIWTCAVGHHVWIRDDERTTLTFNDRVVPAWGHLLLEEHELAPYLEIVRGPSLARRIADYIWRATYINRRCEADFRRAVAASGFEVEVYEPWGGETRPEPELLAELRRRWPAGGAFGWQGLRIQLRKRAAEGRTASA